MFRAPHLHPFSTPVCVQDGGGWAPLYCSSTFGGMACMTDFGVVYSMLWSWSAFSSCQPQQRAPVLGGTAAVPAPAVLAEMRRLV